MLAGLSPVPATVNHFPVLATIPATQSDREICSAIICYRESDNDYVTWMWNHQTSDACHGHYGLDTIKEAAEDFASRTRAYVHELQVRNIRLENVREIVAAFYKRDDS